MKNKIVGFLVTVAIAVVAGYNVYVSQQDMELSDLTLANIEALTQSGENGGESPDFIITCNQDKHVAPRQCWHIYKECSAGWFTKFDDCWFTGYMYDSCVSLCE